MMSRMTILNTAHDANHFVDFSLKNASVTSIKIPLVRNLSRDQQQVQMTSKPQYSSCQNNLQNSIESDLTELSWLTNNVQMLNKSAPFGLIGSPLPGTASMVDFTGLGRENNQINYRNPTHTKKPKLHKSTSSSISKQNHKYSQQALHAKNLNTAFLDYLILNNRINQNILQNAEKKSTNNDDELFLTSLSSSSSSSSSSLSSSSFSIHSPLSSSPSSPASSISSSTNSQRKNTQDDRKVAGLVHKSVKKSSSSLTEIKNTTSDAITNNKQNTIIPDEYVNYKFRNNCGMNKPPLTLSCLIFMALQESRDKCLPVREIYEWIEENFPFYRNSSNNGWKSSIRHNLSFSKCFRKMDRNELVVYRSKETEAVIKRSNDINDSFRINGRKRRAPNSTGTCWKVNSECKSYLIQTLKKSTFWFQNAENYENLSKYINNFPINESKILEHKNNKNDDNKDLEEESHYEEEDTENKNENIKSNLVIKLKPHPRIHNLHHHNHRNSDESHKIIKANKANASVKVNSKKLKLECLIVKSNNQLEQNENSQGLDYYPIDPNNNLLEFVQKQQELFCKKENGLLDSFKLEPTSTDANEPKNTVAFDSKDLAAAAVLAETQNSKFELSLSASSSSLSSDFSLYSSSSSFAPSLAANHDESNDQPENKSNENSKRKRRKSSEDECNTLLTQSNKELETQMVSMNSMSLNSDLEIEVASTLVGMKWAGK